MPSRPTLAAQSRGVTGRKVAELRRDGRLPAVLYGHGVASTAVSVDAHDFDLLRRRTGPNALVDLVVDGRRPQAVLIHGVQVDVVSRRPLHADLLAVRMTEELTVDVPLLATGSAPAAELGAGTLLQVLERVRVRALPDHLPSVLEYDVSGLTEVDAAVRVADLTVPEGVTLLTDTGEIVAKILRARVEEEPQPAAAEPAGESDHEPAGAQGSVEGDRTGGGPGGSAPEA